MHNQLGMKYKRVKPISHSANDEKNLVLRQQFAMKFLNIDLSQKVVLSIDESWVGQTDFRRMKWTFPGCTNSVAQKQMAPRLSLIAALDTNGSLFFALS